MAKAKKSSSNTDGKTIAIISYITIIGWIIALIMNNEKKDKFASYHIRQTLLLWIVWIVISSFLTGINLIGPLLNVALFILWLIAFIGAINGEEKEIYVLGKLAQDWFKGL